MKIENKINISRTIIYTIIILTAVLISILGLYGYIEKWIEIIAVLVSLLAVVIGVFENKVNRFLDKENKIINFCIEVLDNVSSTVPNIIEEIISCIEKQTDIGKLERNLSHNLLKHSIFKKEFNNFYIEFCAIINPYHAKKKDIALINDTVNKLLQWKTDFEIYISDTKYSVLIGTKTSKDLIGKEKNNG